MTDNQLKVLNSVKEALRLLESPVGAILSELRSNPEADLHELAEVETLCEHFETAMQGLEELTS